MEKKWQISGVQGPLYGQCPKENIMLTTDVVRLFIKWIWFVNKNCFGQSTGSGGQIGFSKAFWPNAKTWNMDPKHAHKDNYSFTKKKQLSFLILTALVNSTAIKHRVLSPIWIKKCWRCSAATTYWSVSSGIGAVFLKPFLQRRIERRFLFGFFEEIHLCWNPFFWS